MSLEKNSNGQDVLRVLLILKINSFLNLTSLAMGKIPNG